VGIKGVEAIIGYILYIERVGLLSAISFTWIKEIGAVIGFILQIKGVELLSAITCVKGVRLLSSVPCYIAHQSGDQRSATDSWWRAIQQGISSGDVNWHIIQFVE